MEDGRLLYRRSTIIHIPRSEMAVGSRNGNECERN